MGKEPLKENTNVYFQARKRAAMSNDRLFSRENAAELLGISGNVIAPSENQTKLNHELFRKTIDGYSFINDTTCRYECTLSESELAGEYISEIGLYDSAGDIVCIKTFTKKGKDGDIEMTYTLDDVF